MCIGNKTLALIYTAGNSAGSNDSVIFLQKLRNFFSAKHLAASILDVLTQTVNNQRPGAVKPPAALNKGPLVVHKRKLRQRFFPQFHFQTGRRKHVNKQRITEQLM